jgi:hypothetical protein
LLNKDTLPRTVRVELTGLDGRLVGADGDVVLPPGEITSLNASVVAPAVGGPPRPFSFILRDARSHAVAGEARATLVEVSR